MFETLTRSVTGRTRTVCLVVLGILCGAIVAHQWNPAPLSPRTRYVHAAYWWPKVQGGTALRLAMVHDVLHERYVRHGTAWYGQRAVVSRDVIAKDDHGASFETLDAMDDLSVALIMLHRESDAAAVMREKLQRIGEPPATGLWEKSKDYLAWDEEQVMSPPSLTAVERERYSAHANLGTALIHGAFGRAAHGEAAAKTELREGLAETEQAMELNPLAHFGREAWQAIAVAHLLQAMEHPGMLTGTTLAGESLGNGEIVQAGYFRWHSLMRVPHDGWDDRTMTPMERGGLRKNVGTLQFPKGEENADSSLDPFTGEYPFDEPLLGMIGMWTMGGGSNPHFALAIARLMERDGQRILAWEAYERALEFPEGFWPGGDISAKLTTYSRERQAMIARSEAPTDPAGWQAQRRKSNAEELAWGREYQQEYQEFERRQIAAGAALDDPHFYDAFFRNRPAIASPVGHTDDFVVTQVEPRYAMDYLPCALLGAAAALAIDDGRERVARRRKRRARGVARVL